MIRHSRARHCEILLARDGDEVRAEISDDGGGSSRRATGVTSGSGLRGLSERVAAAGGDLAAEPLPGEGHGGFRLRVSLPLRDGTSPDEGGWL